MSSILRPSAEEALDAWRRLVLADREQVERIREDVRSDYYAPVAASFSPSRRESIEWPIVEALAQPGDTWMDIGAGGGRFAVPLAGIVERVIAVEPSEAMRDVMGQAMTEAGRSNIEIVDTRWPSPAWDREVDVSLAAHSLYDIDDLGGWLDAQEAATRRTCIGIFGATARGAQVADFFEAVHGEPMATLPALREFVAVLGARGKRYEVLTVLTGEQSVVKPAEEVHRTLRRLLWLGEGTELDAKMQRLAQEWYGAEGGLALPPMRPWLGIVSWIPR
ncbi:MAG: methyltransferase domain-containing protein [Dehalococcoidia bacterium]|nr:methyltransferase domain-containing protein [Dehalococcoidia bacterium]